MAIFVIIVKPLYRGVSKQNGTEQMRQMHFGAVLPAELRLRPSWAKLTKTKKYSRSSFLL